jgi:ATP-binding cassette subfamily B protein
VISGTLTNIVRNIVIVVTTLVALFTMSWQLALVGIVVIPLLIIPTRSAGKTRWKLLSESQAKNDEMNQLVNETLSVSGSLLVKLFTREKREQQRFDAVNDEVTKLSMKEQRSGKWFMVLMGMFTEIGPLLIYFAGGWFIIQKTDPTLNVGIITSTVMLINRLYRPVQSLLNIHVDFTRSLALFTRIFDYYDMVPAIRQPAHARRPIITGADIRYEHVAFSYSPEKPLLTDIDFIVPSGKMYAIVGPSGSGKSTIVNLLPRLYDVNGGSVKIGDTDVRDFDLNYLRRSIGVVTQDSYLFNGTIRDNLLYAKENATDAELADAIRLANLTEFIENQPDGLDTVVGNRGLKLSGGEKQRLSIARIILKNPRILILDEATSALDTVTEKLVQDALVKLMKNRTVLAIAHRLSTVREADTILVMKDGRIVERGNHESLYAANGIYRRLCDMQNSETNENSGLQG